MISRSYLMEWAEVAPWRDMFQVEQDLIITRALLDMYEHPDLRNLVAFRGGTALNKLFFNPPSRYSEDIDLVQLNQGPIGPILDSIRGVLDPWLGKPKRTFSSGLGTLLYRMEGEDGNKLVLKVEINSREHFSVLGYQDYPFESHSSYASGNVIIKSYKMEELLGTKTRAVYQRRKGRDLFDLYTALTTMPDLNIDDILKCFVIYTDFVGTKISKSAFLANMELKLKNEEFGKDIIPLLPRYAQSYDQDIAFELVREKLIERL